MSSSKSIGSTTVLQPQKRAAKKTAKKTAKAAKPDKPYPEFPLGAHPSGVWCKRIRGKLFYFGPWNDPDGALAKYMREKDALHAGKRPRLDPEGITVEYICDKFLFFKEGKVGTGELKQRTWNDYKDSAGILVKHFGASRVVEDLDPEDFAELRNWLATKWGPLRVRDVVQRVRSIFKYALENRLIDKPVYFGQGFDRPSRKTLRLERAKKGERMFEADELRRVIEAAIQPLKAMILLGVNCGFGNADVGTLPLSAINLETGWVNYPRPKTGIKRRCPLWPETIAAIREALAKRPKSKVPGGEKLVFATRTGDTWYRETGENPVTHEMKKLVTRLKIDGNKNFYGLRHTFETIGGDSRDQVAVDHIMGHTRDDMASVYRERISDIRLRAVTDHVRAWLFAEADGTEKPDVLPMSKAN